LPGLKFRFVFHHLNHYTLQGFPSHFTAPVANSPWNTQTIALEAPNGEVLLVVKSSW